jgi:DNA-binding winged helix-turn-helix (wHTH) protein/Tol biopolymer transport system component
VGASSNGDQRIRFDEFELDAGSEQLLRNGQTVRIQPQPLRVLKLFLEHAGKTISREELRRHIWGDKTYVEFEQGLNYCVRQIRRALNDSSSHPRYIETLPKQGYRFIGQVERREMTSVEPNTSLDPTGIVGPEAHHLCADEPDVQDSRLITRRKLIWSACVGLFGAAGASVFTKSTRHGSGRPIRLEIRLPEGTAAADPGRLLGPPVVAPNGDSLVVTLQSPDGAYLYVRPLDADRLIRIEGTEGASFPFWSSDGQKIAFFAHDKLKYLPARGGSVTVLCDAPQARGGAWGSRNLILFSAARTKSMQQEIFRIPGSGGTPVATTHLNTGAGENSHRYPQFLSNGRGYLYFVRSDNLDFRGVYLSSIDQPNRRTRLNVSDGPFAVGNNGSRTYLLTQQAGKLIAEAFDPERGTLSGNRQQLMEHPASFSISNSGVLAARTEEQELSTLRWRDRSGRDIGSFGPPGDYWSVSLSADDRFMAVVQHNFLNGDFTGWFSPISGGYFEPFSSSHHVANPFWLPARATLFFTDSRKRLLFSKTMVPRGGEVVTCSLPEGVAVEDISRDRRYVVAQLSKRSTQGQILWATLPLRIENVVEWHSTGAYGSGDLQPTFSPDGNWLAYGSYESGSPQVYVMDFPAGESRLRLSTDGGYGPRWRRDGKELFYLSLDGSLMSVHTSSIHPWNTEGHRKLFSTNTRLATEAGRLYDATANGQRFILIEGGSPTTEARIEVLLNWPSLLTQ